MKIREIIRLTLRELHRDKVIDCNNYQGLDFDNLYDKVCDNIEIIK